MLEGTELRNFLEQCVGRATMARERFAPGPHTHDCVRTIAREALEATNEAHLPQPTAINPKP